MPIHLEKRLLSVEEYHLKGEVGILNSEDRVELIQGEIIKMSPYKSAHTSCVKRITAWMYRLLGDQVTISVQDPYYDSRSLRARARHCLAHIC